MKLHNDYQNTAVIDADFIIWIATNGNKVLGKDGLPLKETGKFVYTPKTLDQAIDTCNSCINDLLKRTKADSYIICLTAPNNFRYSIASDYKANRVGLPLPLWHKEIKNYLKTFLFKSKQSYKIK